MELFQIRKYSAKQFDNTKIMPIFIYQIKTRAMTKELRKFLTSLNPDLMQGSNTEEPIKKQAEKFLFSEHYKKNETFLTIPIDYFLLALITDEF